MPRLNMCGTNGRRWLCGSRGRRQHPRTGVRGSSNIVDSYQLSPEIAALFPDRFEDSPLGPIPAGWRVGTLGELCEKPQYGFTASASDEPIGPRFLRITDINKNDWIEWGEVPFCEIDSEYYLKYALQPGDMVIARMADPGHGALIEEKVDAVFASYLIRFRPRHLNLRRYLQYWVRSKNYWDLVSSRQSGTTRANLNAQVLASFMLLVPSSKILEEFSRVVDSLRNDLVASVNQSRTLAALRDALLPKLISGELRVPDAERIVGRAT
jgi:type I restriction enzyme S subunit